MTNQAPFPHCDGYVLHAPSKCVYCDMYPSAQQSRVDAGIQFTGEPYEEGQIADPAQDTRPLETINRWGGNQARKPE